jgi:outer membrane protein OmpA-like peptidoglycan-associated protein
MKRALTALVSLSIAFVFLGCSTPLSTREKGAGIGALGGAAAGGAIGAATGHAGAGAAIGGLLGLGAGALIGDQLQGQEQKQTEQQRQLDQQRAEIEKNRALLDELKRSNIEARETDRGVAVNLPSVNFQFDSSNLTSEGQERVRQIASIVNRQARDRRISVEGHASKERADQEAYNQQLSDRRARTVADELAYDGLDPNRVSSRGLGTRSPIASNDSEEGRSKNRRVEVIIEN